MTQAATNATATPIRRERAWLVVSGPLLVWAAFTLVMAGYSALRAACDAFGPIQQGRGVETAMFGFIPTIFLQDHIYGAWSTPLDKAGFIVHAMWFPTAYLFGAFIMARDRRRLMEFLWWVALASFMGCIGYALMPTTPPWMEPDVARIMHERPLWTSFNYLEADANEVAAFPSLHAAIPLVVGLFCLLRVPSLRWLGWVGVGQALVTGAFMVYLGEHWVFDILGGYALAGVVALLFCSGAIFRALGFLPGRIPERCAAINAAVFPRQGAVVVPLRRKSIERRAA